MLVSSMSSSGFRSISPITSVIWSREIYFESCSTRPPSNMYPKKFFWLKQHTSISLSKSPFLPSSIPPWSYSALHVRLESKSHEKLFVLVMCDVALQRNLEGLNRWALNVESFLTRFVTAAQLTLPMYTLTLKRDFIQVRGNAGILSIGEMPSGVSEDSLTWVPILAYPYWFPAPPDSPNKVCGVPFW